MVDECSSGNTWAAATKCQISASVTGSSCDTVTYVTSVTNARSNTSPSEEVPPPYWDSQCLAKVLAGNLSKLADEIPSAGKTLLPHALPGAQPITPCHCPSVLSCPSAEGRNISISTSWCKTDSLMKFSLNTILIFTWPWVDRRPQSCITNLVFVLVLQFLLVVW